MSKNVYFDTVEENEDQFLRANGKPPTATKSNTSCTTSFTISMKYKKGYTMLNGTMNSVSQKVGGFSLEIQIVLASVVQSKFWGVLQIINHSDHKFPFASDIPNIFIL